MEPVSSGASTVALLLLATLVSKIIDTLKFLRAGQYSSAMTQIITWVGGVLAVGLFAQTDLAEGVVVPGTTVVLATSSFATQIFVGLLATSVLSKIYDYQKARDHSDSAVTPPLIPLSADRPGRVSADRP